MLLAAGDVQVGLVVAVQCGATVIAVQQGKGGEVREVDALDEQQRGLQPPVGDPGLTVELR